MTKHSFEVTEVRVSDRTETTICLGVFSSFAPTPKKAMSNIRFRHHFRDHDEGNTEVLYLFRYLVHSRPVTTRPTYKTIDGEDNILTDGGVYEPICD